MSSAGKIRSYSKSYEKFDGGIKSLQWSSYKAAAIRYKNLVENIDFEGKTVLDVGCGFGDVIPFIVAKTSNFQYTGVDLLEVFTNEAQKRYPEFEFIAKDFFTTTIKTYDIVLCSGALNGKSTQPIKDRSIKIKKLFEHTNDTLVFNMAGGIKISNSDTSRVVYVPSTEILNYCLTLTTKIIFKQHYHKKDFTIALFK